MKIKYSQKCKSCRLSKIDKQLQRRIFESAYFNDNGLENLKDIHRDYQSAFAYNRFLHHCQNHIIYTDKDKESFEVRLGLREDPKLKGKQVQATNQQPNQLQATEPGRENEVFDSVMELGLKDLKAGKLKIKTGDLINAAKTKSELALKKKDQELKIQEMIWHFASGENERNQAYDQQIIEGETATTYDASAITSENTRRR